MSYFFCLNQTVDSIKGHTAVVTYNTTTSVSIWKTCYNVCFSCKTHLRSIGTKNSIVVGCHISSEDFFEFRIDLISVSLSSLNCHTDISQIPGTREEELIAVGGGRTISYLVYSPESELSYDLFAIMDKLELIGSMGSYYDAYRLLRTQPLSGRYVLEELTVLTAASPKMRKEQRLKQLDGYRAYTYMRKRWEKYLRNHGLAEVPWEDAIDLILVFVSPIWESLCRNEIFFDDWMPELGRFLG